MGRYYLSCGIIGAILAVIVFIISSIGSCVNLNDVKKDVKGYKDYCIVRYFTDDEEDAKVEFKTVKEGTYLEFSSSNLPYKEGYVFAGFYDDADFNYGTQYVNAEGEGLKQITEDVVLYPIFAPLGGN